MAVEIFLSFIMATVISFIGSLQPGPVNLSVLHAAVVQNRSSALKLAFGGALPELLYCGLAMAISVRMLNLFHVQRILEFALAPVLFLSGVALLIKSSSVQKKGSEWRTFPFAKGLFLGLLNPLLLPFWSIVILKIQSGGNLHLEDPIARLSFVAGSFFGAFLLLVLIARVVDKPSDKTMIFFKSKGNKLFGVVFIILAFLEILRQT